jgi:hypothetical protein
MSDVEVHIEVKLPGSSSSSSTSTSTSSSSSSTSSQKKKQQNILSNAKLHVDDNINSLNMKYRLQVPLDDIFGSIHSTSLGNSDSYNDYLDGVMRDIDSTVDDMYCGWT